MIANWPVTEILSALRGMFVKIVEDNQEICSNILSAVMDDGGRRQKITRIVNEEPTVVSPRVDKLLGDLKLIKMMPGCEGFTFMDPFRFLSVEGLTW